MADTAFDTAVNRAALLLEAETSAAGSPQYLSLASNARRPSCEQSLATTAKEYPTFLTALIAVIGDPHLSPPQLGGQQAQC